jgi:NADH-quinone oxidoreductase subunit M
MTDSLFPWLETAILVAIVGAIGVGRLRDGETKRKWALVCSGIVMACALGLWTDFLTRDPRPTGLAYPQRWNFFLVDELNGPLIVVSAFLYLLTIFATARTKSRRFCFAWTLVSEAILLGTLGCREPWGVIALLAAGTLPPYFELRARSRPTRVFVLHMGLFVALLVAGYALADANVLEGPYSWLALVSLLGAIFIRIGIAPFHCWMTDLFEHATFGTALLFVAPMVGAFAAVRLVLPIAPDWVLRGIGLVSLFTALYAAGMALVQSEGRRFFCYVFLSHSALVLVGVDTIPFFEQKGEATSLIGLTGGLVVWLSGGLALTGFGLTLHALEARHGRLSLTRYHGLYEYTPALAVCFLLTGLASLGFPGTFGFLGVEMLVNGAVDAYPYVGIAIVIVAALSGIAVVKAYFVLFTGTKHISSVPLELSPRERFAVLLLVLLIVLGGLFPQPGAISRYIAAEDILKKRKDWPETRNVGPLPDPRPAPSLAHEGFEDDRRSHCPRKCSP